jgi:enediyne biosynthesis protein E4
MSDVEITRARRPGWAAAWASAAAAIAALAAGQSPPSDPQWPTFVDVTAELGIDFRHRASPTPEKYLLETMGSGVAVFDADGDGRLDLFFVNGAALAPGMAADAVPQKVDPSYWNRLYLQKADGTFEDATERAGLAGAGYGMGVAVGDYDNDGDPDLYVTAYPRNALYRNEGGGRFVDVTEEAGVAGSGWSSSAAFVDVDADGRLDLVVVRYLAWDLGMNPWCGERKEGYRAYCHPDLFDGVSPIVFRNEGKGRFKDVSVEAGLSKALGKALGIAIADYDRDGHIDLFVANDSVRQFLFRGRGDGTFEERAMSADAAFDEDGRVYAGMGVDFADYDNDGWPDAIITNLSNQRYALYRNAADGTFTYETHASGIGRLTALYSGWGVRFVDLDHDGWKDLVIAQGHVLDTIELTSPHLRYAQPPLAARNVGGTQFVDMARESGPLFATPLAARGLATGDLDGDGDIDLVFSTTDGRAYVLRNEGGNRASWLGIALEGRRSNRDGIGARIRVVTPGGHEQWATVTTASSYLSASDRRVHVGLAGAPRASLVEVTWPSGRVTRVEDAAAGQVLTIVEPVDP